MGSDPCGQDSALAEAIKQWPYSDRSGLGLVEWVSNMLIPTAREKDSTFDIWLVVWNMTVIFPCIGKFIIPIDFHIFQRS